MKALLVTIVERTKATTMGADTEVTHRIKIVPWKEVAEIDLGDEGENHILIDVEGKQTEVSSYSYINIEVHTPEYIKACVTLARQAIKAMTPPPEPVNGTV